MALHLRLTLVPRLTSLLGSMVRVISFNMNTGDGVEKKGIRVHVQATVYELTFNPRERGDGG